MRPDAQIFLHVLGATTLFGATGAVAVMGLVARPRTERLPLARATFRTLLVLALPAWIVMLAFGTWAESKESYWSDDAGWLGLGYGVADAGIVVLLASTGLAYWWTRRPSGWQGTAVGILAAVYLVALAAAWWAMSAKVPT
jgi:hypothetical protein